MSIVESYRVEGDKVWQRFASMNKDDHIWWYESTVRILKKRNASGGLVSRIEELLAEIK